MDSCYHFSFSQQYLKNLLQLNASHCSLTSLSYLPDRLYLSHLYLNSNRLNDLQHIYKTLQTLPSITALHLFDNPFHTTLLNSFPHPNNTLSSSLSSNPESISSISPISLFSLSSYTIMILTLYSYQLTDLDNSPLLASDFSRLQTLLYHLKQENLIDTLQQNNQEQIKEQMILFSRLKAFHLQTENFMEKQMKMTQQLSTEKLKEQIEYIRERVRERERDKSIEEMFEKEEREKMKEERLKLIESGIMREKEKEKATDKNEKGISTKSPTKGKDDFPSEEKRVETKPDVSVLDDQNSLKISPDVPSLSLSFSSLTPSQKMTRDSRNTRSSSSSSCSCSSSSGSQSQSPTSRSSYSVASPVKSPIESPLVPPAVQKEEKKEN